MIKKTVRIGTKDFGYGGCKRIASVFVTIKFDDGRLSITGVEGPKADGNAWGSAGQIDLSSGPWVEFAPGWDAEMVAKLQVIWSDWHLNDMQAGNPQQMAWLKANPVSFTYPETHYQAATKALDAAGMNPEGDRYGHKWHRIDVPADVLAWLEALPETDKPSPWRD